MKVKIRKTYKYRIYPTRAQKSNLENQFSMCRILYNQALEERKQTYEKEKKTISYCDQAIQLPALKKTRPWYKGVYSQVLQDTLKRLDKAHQNFFRRVKNKETPGYPKFVKRGQWKSVTYPQYRKQPCSKIKVPKVGIIKMVCHRQLPEGAKIKTLTIIKQAGKWFACFSVEIALDIELKQDLQSCIGIDLGLIDFFYDSNKKNVKAPKYLRKKEKHLKRLQRRFSKAKKYSKKWYKLLRAVQKCHYRVWCRRNNFLHKQANIMLEKISVIFHENLKVKNMLRRPKSKQDKETGQYLPNGASAKAGLNKSISDAAWTKFIDILKYKSIMLGKQLIGVPPHFTSQKCSSCGEIVKKSLSIRTHRCHHCGFVANRDHNAALNILRVGLDTLTVTTV